MKASTPMKARRPEFVAPPAVSSISSGTDRDVHLSASANPEIELLEQSLHEMSIAEEELDEEKFNDLRNSIIDWVDDTSAAHPKGSEDQDSSDEDYVPVISLRMGGALKYAQDIDELPIIGIDDSVHDLSGIEEPTDVPEMLPTHFLPDNVKVEKGKDIVDVKAAIVYENCLRQLVDWVKLPFDNCPKGLSMGERCESSAPFKVVITTRGTAMKVEWMCSNGHQVWFWDTQPRLNFGMQAGDFMLSSNILLSGNNYAKVALLFKFMNLRMVNRNTFFTVQDTYCVDAITEFWIEKISQSIASLQGKQVVLLGDGRNDSPGHCAQYCSYTTMENETKEIINVSTVDKRQTCWNSNIMEKEAFIRTLEKLSKEIQISEICTDAHVQIAALLDPEKGKYKNLKIHHSLDMWHGAKNLSKKLAAAAKVKGQSLILVWLKDIINHFWWCCKTAGTREQFLGLWIGILHHVCNKHSWALGSCQHGHLEEDYGKEWLQQDSNAHKALVDIILSKRWLGTVHKYLHFRSTAELEGFQNHLLMYTSKRQAFTPPVYEARVLLAALDYNYHRNLPTLTTSEGNKIFRRKYNKNARRYTLYALKEGISYKYITDLQEKIINGRLSSQVGMPRRRTLRMEDPRRLGVVPPVPPPTISELQQTQVSRGLGLADQVSKTME
ncbi:uncharacterized protein LOC144015549 isoform X2 [Festucalex cinctus]